MKKSDGKFKGKQVENVRDAGHGNELKKVVKGLGDGKKLWGNGEGTGERKR